MYVKRNLKSDFQRTDSNHAIVAVVGPRQAGKTTFLKERMKSKEASYVLFDDPDARELFEEDVKKFDSQYVEGHEVSVLDEIQYCDEAGSKLKYLADTGRNLWVTSSSETILQKNVLSHLVGRVSIHKLYPFNFEEFLRAKDQKELTPKIRKRLIWEHITYGGYPDAVTANDKEAKKDILRNLYKTMLLKDVAQTFSIEDVDKLEKLVKYLSHNIGDEIAYQKVSKDLDLTFKTLKKYLTALEQSYVIEQVKPFHTNKKKELVKRPKIYFIDTGLRNMVARNFPDKATGELFENYVYTELLKQGLEPKYWRTKSQSEVDFIIDEKIPVEVKKNYDEERIPSGLKSYIETYQPEQAYILYMEGSENTLEYKNCKIKLRNLEQLKQSLK